ncbi:flagellar biosynthetic protein FliO [Legionella worsleiensis]|uniref:Flagellar protein n=1 Tax=Legionella worsleiensis TaxID=45076 RepID=A0A0W1A4C5_9GAMM|nr:flagellar biosynthetic protein FliO [Legionella worsleiensis]KTD76191.1 flagellar protein fliO [Legionella worsleiensis]STY33233.1 flagellar assembly protein FliO [Legionella worsleiensis]
MITKTYCFVILLLCSVLSEAHAVGTGASNMISQGELLRVFSGLLLVLLVIVLLSWVVKRLHGANFSSSNGLQSLASLTLGPKERILLIKAGTRYLLMGVGSCSVNLLYDFGEELPSGFELNNKATFAHLLKSAVGTSK